MRRFLPAVLLLLPALVCAEEKVAPPELLKGLENKDAKVRIKAIKGLSKLGLEAVPPLVKSLKDEEATVVNAATYALSLLRVEPKMLVESLQPHLKDNSVSVRKGVTWALRKGGVAAVPALEISLADKEVSVRRQAVQSLEVVVGKMPAAAKEVVPALEKVVGDTSSAIRVDVARTLGRCGPEALPPTLKLADDEDGNVRAYALASLMRLKVPVAKVLPILAKKAKDDPEVRVRQSALSTLAKLGKDAIPAVTAALADKNPAVQKSAVQALVALSPKAMKEVKPAIPTLKEMAVKSENDSVRSIAVAALGQLGSEGEEALLGVLSHDDSVTRMACLQYLGKKGKAPKSSVPDLIKSLTDKDPEVRILAAHVLGLIGTDAKSALPALEKSCKDEDKRVVEIAEKSIKMIKGE